MLRRSALRTIAAAILTFGLGATARAAEDPNALPLAVDLARDARDAAASGRALVVLYSLPDCPWCARLRREYLGPMLRDPAEAKRVILREIDITGTQPLVAPDGTRTTHRDFARKNAVRFSPVTAFIAPDGSAAAESIVGYPPGGFYGAYIEDRIEEARKRGAAAR